MRKLQISTILLGGILLAPLQSAVAQEVAYANESTPGYVIFFSNGPAHLSSVAGETIQMAATDADRSAGLIRVLRRSGLAYRAYAPSDPIPAAILAQKRLFPRNAAVQTTDAPARPTRTSRPAMRVTCSSLT